NGDLRDNKQHAVTCYLTALRTLDQQQSAGEWAATQSNLGDVFVSLVRLENAAGAQTDLLDQAETAYRSALSVYIPEHNPTQWSVVQRHLGDVIKARADLALGETRADLLQQAVSAYSAALSIHVDEDDSASQPIARAQLARLLDQVDVDLRRVFFDDIL